MFLAVAAVEIAVTLRETVAARRQAAVPDLLRLAVPAARLRQTVRAHLLGVEDVHLLVIAQDPRRAVRDVLLLLDASEGMAVERSRGPQATTAEGYLGINHDLLPLKTNRAHQHPGCRDPDPARRRAAAAQDQAVHGL